MGRCLPGRQESRGRSARDLRSARAEHKSRRRASAAKDAYSPASKLAVTVTLGRAARRACAGKERVQRLGSGWDGLSADACQNVNFVRSVAARIVRHALHPCLLPEDQISRIDGSWRARSSSRGSRRPSSAHDWRDTCVRGRTRPRGSGVVAQEECSWIFSSCALISVVWPRHLYLLHELCLKVGIHIVPEKLLHIEHTLFDMGSRFLERPVWWKEGCTDYPDQ